MKVGDLNKKVGWLLLLLFMLGGFAFGQRSWVARMAQDVLWLQSQERKSFFMVHSHGIGLAILNILYGLYIDEVSLSNRMKKIGSYLAVAGAIFMPLTILAWGQAMGPYRATVFGAVLEVIAVFILVYGLFQKTD
jgi:uncharacterized membrane protein (DUF2068 family)